MDYERFARLQARFTDEKLLTNEGVLSVALVREGAVRTSLYQNWTLWRVCLPAADQGHFF
ncbi:hypothetical protein IGJ12_002305 [Enterococcus sp. DIV0802b]